MEGKNVSILILSLIILILIPIFIYVSWGLSIKSSPKALSLEECKTYTYKGENKINLLFFSSQKDVEKYKDFLFSTSPFDENKDLFNIYYIDSYEPECEIYQGIAVLCKSKEMLKKASSCPNDYIFVIKDIEDGSIRSSTYNNIVSINSKHPLTVLTHEFGHAFANLADEYIPASIPSGSKNCPSSCDKFSSEVDGCYQGCSDNSHFRSIENGLMKTLSNNNYGKYNSYLIKDVLNKKGSSLLSGAVVSQTSSCNLKGYYLVQSNYVEGNYEVKSVSLEKGCASKTSYGDYSYNLISEEKVVQDTNFYGNKVYIEGPSYDINSPDPGEIMGGGLQEISGEFFTAIPFSQDIDEINIIDDKGKIHKIQVEKLNSRPCLIE